MKKKYKVEIDCAACALKVEDALNKIENIDSVNINFMTGKMTIEAEDITEELLDICQKEGSKIESDFKIIR